MFIKYQVFLGSIFIFVIIVNSTSQSHNDLRIIFQDALKKFDVKYHQVSFEEISKIAKLYLGTETANYLISPLWLQLLLLTLSLGASGKTLDELNSGIFLDKDGQDKLYILQNTLDHLPKSGKNLRLEVINMLFLRDDLNTTESFKNVATEKFNTTVHFIDFSNITASRIKINEKILQRNQRRMVTVFDDSDLKPNHTSIVLMNSVYFKDKWLYPPTVLNGTYDFKADINGTNKKIPMYRITALMKYAEIEEWDAVVIEIPYETEGVSLLVFVPNKVDGLMKVNRKILEQQDTIAYANSIMKETPIAITLPKFTLDVVVILPNKLEKMGVKYIFDDKAELDEMIGRKNVSFTTIMQRVKIWADEGKGAYKDTGDVEYPIPQKVIVADHPFFFIVKINGDMFILGQFVS